MNNNERRVLRRRWRGLAADSVSPLSGIPTRKRSRRSIPAVVDSVGTVAATNTFQVTEVISKSAPIKWNNGRDDSGGDDDGDGDRIYIFGRRDDGKSIAVVVEGFDHYFYASVRYRYSDDYASQHIADMVSEWMMKNERFVSGVESMSSPSSGRGTTATRCVSINGYATAYLKNVFRVSVRRHYYLNKCVQSFRRAFRDVAECTFFETDATPSARFIVDTDIRCGQWIRYTAAAAAAICANRANSSRLTHCDLEMRIWKWAYSHEDGINCGDLRIVPDEHSRIAPIKFVSFDIECLNRPGVFPVPQHDPVIHVGMVCAQRMVDENVSRVLQRVAIIFHDDSSSRRGDGEDDGGGGDDGEDEKSTGAEELPAIRYIYCDTETKLYEEFQRVMLDFDPDYLLGYNCDNFDFKYLYQRSKYLGSRELYWGRIRGSCVAQRVTTFQSAQTGSRERVITHLDGRASVDMMNHVKAMHKFRSYKLDNVADHFLGLRKQDVPPNQIGQIHLSGARGRRRLAIYCLHDALLPLRLADKLCSVIYSMQMAHLTYLNVSDLVTRGQQIRILTQLRATAVARARDHGILYLIPGKHQQFEGESSTGSTLAAWTSPAIRDSHERCAKRVFQTYSATDAAAAARVPQRTSSASGARANKTAQFEGAHVIAPICKFYAECPAIVLDFLSLYPHVMITMNICLSTWVRPADYEALAAAGVKMNRCPNGACFVAEPPGLIPLMLRKLLDARSATKRKMKTMDPASVEYSVQNSIQLAQKICANSAYGFTGCSTAAISNVAVAEAVTKYGQKLLVGVKHDLERVYRPPSVRAEYGNENEYVIKIIYGDTDSVFVTAKRVKRAAEPETSERVKRVKMETSKETSERVKRAAEPETSERVKRVKMETSKEANTNLEEDISLEEAFALGRDMACFLNEKFAGKFTIEFEKVLISLVLIAKKKYLGMKMETLDSTPVNDHKGIETVRRDNCVYTSECLNECINILMRPELSDVARLDLLYKTVKRMLDELRGGDATLYEKLAISKEYRKVEYVAKQPHIAVVEKMRARDAASAPKLGDRVTYVILEENVAKSMIAEHNCRATTTTTSYKSAGNTAGKLRLYEMAEDMVFARTNKLKLNIKYYITKQFLPALERILKNIDPDSWTKIEKLCKESCPINEYCARVTYTR